MAIQKWRLCSSAVAIEQYLEMELPVSRISENGALIDSITVEIIKKDTLVLYARVARSRWGYHYDLDYETPTGGSCGPVHCKDPVCIGKLDVLRHVIDKAKAHYWITKHCGNGLLLEQAMKRLKRYECVQLTLF